MSLFLKQILLQNDLTERCADIAADMRFIAVCGLQAFVGKRRCCGLAVGAGNRNIVLRL